MVDGARREATATPIDLEASPGALWQVEPVSLGSVTVTTERFRAALTPSTPAFVLRWVGFEPAGAVKYVDDRAHERAERLRGLGYVQ